MYGSVREEKRNFKIIRSIRVEKRNVKRCIYKKKKESI